MNAKEQQSDIDHNDEEAKRILVELNTDAQNPATGKGGITSSLAIVLHVELPVEQDNKQDGKPEGLQKKMEMLMIAVRFAYAKKHMTYDNLPIEVLPGLYIGSIGAALSRKNLKEAGITHILCVADKVQAAYPNVTFILIRTELNVYSMSL